jgi:uncharacterized membrane protein YdbT with pleckstrin-like domain
VGYLEKNLLPGETVDYRAHLHPIIFLQAALFALIGLAFVVFGLLNAGLSYFWMLGALFLLYAAAVGGDRAIHYATSEFAITNKRVVIKVGFINRKTLEMVLTKVETIRVDQSILGRVLNFGTIVVTGTGGTNEPFASIANPLEFRRQVQARTAG